MDELKPSIVLAIIAATAFIIALGPCKQAGGEFHNLPPNVEKFKDGKVTCYVYHKDHISCVYDGALLK